MASEAAPAEAQPVDDTNTAGEQVITQRSLLFAGPAMIGLILIGLQCMRAFSQRDKSVLNVLFTECYLDFAQVITPWDVTGGIDGKIDYGRLIREVQIHRHPCKPCS